MPLLEVSPEEAFFLAQKVKEDLQRFDHKVVTLMSKHGSRLLRLSLGVIFLWFGVLKFFPNLSPAEELATITVQKLSAGLVSRELAPRMVALLETIIGLGLLTGRFPRATLFLLFIQMLGTFTPLILFPQKTFIVFPVVPSFEGHYIIKNLVLVAAAIAIGPSVKGKPVKPDPSLHQKDPPLLKKQIRD